MKTPEQLEHLRLLAQKRKRDYHGRFVESMTGEEILNVVVGLCFIITIISFSFAVGRWYEARHNTIIIVSPLP